MNDQQQLKQQIISASSLDLADRQDSPSNSIRVGKSTINDLALTGNSTGTFSRSELWQRRE
jgi:hypothetical protein